MKKYIEAGSFKTLIKDNNTVLKKTALSTSFKPF